MKLQGGSGVLRPAPDPPLSVDTPTAHPTSLSIGRVPGEVSRQQVAYFFPVASHSWLGAAGSRAPCLARDPAALLLWALLCLRLKGAP